MKNTVKVNAKKLLNGATMPTYGSAYAAGAEIGRASGQKICRIKRHDPIETGALLSTLF